MCARDVETLASQIARDTALTDLDAAGWIVRLAKALEPLHALGVAHGNITGDAVLAGGAARTSPGFLVEPRRVQAVAAYHSPERTAGEGASCADDTWAAGVLLYLALTGSLPFPGADDGEVRAKIFGPPAAPLAVFDAGDDALQEILDRVLARDLSGRLTSIRELREALEAWHPDPELKELPALDDAPAGDAPAAGGSAAAGRPGAGAPGAGAPGAGAPAAPAAPMFPRAAPMAAGGLLPASDEEDGPTRVREGSSAQAYLAALQASAASGPTATPGLIPAPPAPTRQREQRATRLRRLPAPTPPPVKKSPSVAPGPMPPPAPAPERTPAGTPTGGLFDDDEPTVFAPTSTMMRAQAAGVLPGAPATTPPPAPAAAPPPPAVVPSAPAAPGAVPAAPGAPAAAAVPGAPVAAAAPGAPVAPPAPASSGEPAARRGSRTPILVGAALLIAAGAAAYFVMGAQGAPGGGPASGPPADARGSETGAHAHDQETGAQARSPETDPPAGAAASASSTAATTATATTTAGNAESASSTAASAAGAPASASPGEVAACLMPMFAAGTFVEPPASLASVCAITDPRKGGELVRKQVILGGTGRGVSDGMREWGVLGLYEMAAFAVLRATCCPSAPPLDIPVTVPSCDIETPLNELARAAASAATSDADLSAALNAYTTQARCISRADAASAYGQRGRLQGGELETFQKTLERARAVVKKR